MDAHKALISDIFNYSTLIEIPFFQRAYVWKDDLWSRFLDDMVFLVESKKPHFFGSIILKEGRLPSQGDQFTKSWTIVDGQQRLTTLILFMRALSLMKGQTAFFDGQFKLMGQSIALKHGRNDIDAFEKVVAMTKPKCLDNPEPESNLINAYNYFIQNINPDQLDIITICTYAQFVKIELTADEDEQQIFDTINSLGVSLTTSELLKNYFFSRETVSDYESKWADVFEKDDDSKQYWYTTIETGRIKRAMIDIFFDSYFQIFIQNRAYSITNEDKVMYDRADKLAQSYQHFINNYCYGNKDVVLGQLKDYAKCFMNTFNVNQCNMSIPRSSGIERLNVIIFGLKTSTLIPYVLYVAKNVYDEEERNKIYGILESYVMRRIVMHATTKNYNNIFTSLISNRVLDSESLSAKLQTYNDSTTYIPSDDDLRNGFNTSKLVNLQSKGIVYLIESKIRPTSSSVALLGFNSYSLEHLMPKKWRNNWEPCATEEEARTRDSVLLTLGNLAIITQSLNASIRDAEWLIKKKGKGDDKPGLEMCASGLVTLFDVLNKDVWNELEIANRAVWLCEQAISIWNIQ